MKITGAILDRSGEDRPFARSRPLRIVDVELDEPGPQELLVRIESAGICHSDLSVVNGDRPRPLPMLLGHEAAGIVEEVGSAVSDVTPGQRVIMTFLPRCGLCAGCASDGRIPCERGSAANARGELLSGGTRLHEKGEPINHHLGVSAFATHAVVDQRSVVAVADDIPPDVAALLGCAVLTGGGAVLTSGANPNAPLGIVGLGGVGMAAVLTAVALGYEVTAIDPVLAKRDLARTLGASSALAPEEISKSLRLPTVIEAAGNIRAFETAFQLTDIGGTTVTAGLPAPGATASVSPTIITGEARTIRGSYLGSAVPSRDIPVFASLWRERRLPVEKLISSHLDLRDINDALDSLADGSALRQILHFN